MTAKSSIVPRLVVCNNPYFYKHSLRFIFKVKCKNLFWLKNFNWVKPFSQKNTWWLAQKGTDEKNMVTTTRVRLYFYVYTRSATRRQTVMVDINLLLSHFPRFLVCFATMAAELWRIGPNPDISLTSNIPSLTSSNKVIRVVTSLALAR